VDEGLKRRLVGATVLVSLVVIFVPMLLEHEPEREPGIEQITIPPQPPVAFPSRVLPEEDEQIAIPPSSVTAVKRLPSPPAQGAGVETPVAAAPESQPVAKPAAEAPAARPLLSAWVIQAGSFSNRGNADKLTQQLRDKGFPAFVEQAQVKGKTVARVLVGPEVERRLAENLMTQLNRELQTHDLVGKLKVYSGPGYRPPE